jgi:hypothetical protein
MSGIKSCSFVVRYFYFLVKIKKLFKRLPGIISDLQMIALDTIAIIDFYFLVNRKKKKIDLIHKNELYNYRTDIM